MVGVGIGVAWPSLPGAGYRSGATRHSPGVFVELDNEAAGLIWMRQLAAELMVVAMPHLACR